MVQNWNDMPQQLRDESLKAAQELTGELAGPMPSWMDEKGKIDEPAFAADFLAKNQMRCFHGELFTPDGRVESEEVLKNQIYRIISPWVKRGTAKKADTLLQTIRLSCVSEMPALQTDRIHVSNGTLFLDGKLSEAKEFCINRLPVAYHPDAPEPVCWKRFLTELLYEEDIVTLQEYMGYCLLPVTKAQKMLIIVGNGGEGKSRVGLIMRTLLGDNMYLGSLQKLEVNRFARASLEFKLAMVDDDMNMEALASTSIIKTLVTLEDKIDIERKGIQSSQGVIYSRLMGFGNGTLQALYDKSKGFYRRQLLLVTRERPEEREDDPDLIEKMRREKESILLWAFRGLQRLVSNNYQFTISERAAENLNEAMERGNNILAFLKSAGSYFEVRQGAKCKSSEFYERYKRWCADNTEKAYSASTFLHHMKENQKSLGIIYNNKCVDGCRGFENVFLPFMEAVDKPDKAGKASAGDFEVLPF